MSRISDAACFEHAIASAAKRLRSNGLQGDQRFNAWSARRRLRDNVVRVRL